ncbi:DUF1758 and Peptidase A17 domain containing prote in [Elysia marginata]|uniref:DUF1758 and Peptidase A17 domain containing prote in n=1 Tax=Elysia marginata TaxID=1093978 RepID=A0AAV4FXW0_9GAST|nr:DUF1758 and Peptidase A17 domain containing prote in [Elysia marginata]
MVRKSSLISKLSVSPFLGEDELVRVKGRLDNAPSHKYDERHPVVLSKGHFSLMLIRSQHKQMKDAGVETLITAMRNKYWIVGVRTLVRKVCKQCISCQRQDSRPQDQAIAPLPSDRITRSPPFLSWEWAMQDPHRHWGKNCTSW